MGHLNLPPALVKPRDCQRRQGEVVGQEDKPPVVLGIVKRNATKWVGIQPRRLPASQDDCLIAPQSRRLGDGATSTPCKIEASFGSRHEERRTSREPMKTAKIDVSSIHHVERVRFRSADDRERLRRGFSRGKSARNRGCCRAGPRACAASRPPCVGGTAPRGTGSSRGRSLYCRGRRRSAPGPHRRVPRQRASALDRSALEQSRRRCASRECGWHRPTCSARSSHESPRGRASARQPADTSRCRGGFRERSVVQTPSREIDPGTRSHVDDDRLHTADRSGYR